MFLFTISLIFSYFFVCLKVNRAKVKSNRLCQKKRQDDKEEEVKVKKLKEKEELLTAKPAEHLNYDWHE